jgi:hypothetical protein
MVAILFRENYFTAKPITMNALKFFIIGMVIFLAGSMQAQVAVNVSIGSPPLWGPAGHAEARYYYLPDVEAYYDVPTSMFIYNTGGVWVHRAQLPPRYRNYDLYGGYKVVMSDYRGDAPYANFKEHKMKYGRGYHGNPQKTIGERPGRGGHNQKMFHQGNPGNQPNGHGNVRNAGPGKMKNMKGKKK